MNGMEKIPKKPCPYRLFIFYFSYAVLINLRRDNKALRATDVRFFLIVEEKISSGNEVEKVHYLNEMATLLPNLLYTKMAVALLNQS